MSAEIDRLEINIEASASSAADKINSLADSLERIASSSSGIRDKLNNAADGFLNLKDSVKGMGDAIKSITKLNDALSNLSEITVPKGLKDLADVAKPLQSISDSIGNFANTEDLQKTSVQLQALTQSLRSVSRVEIKNSDKLRDFVNNISSLQVDSENLSNLKSLATAVSKITNAKVNEAAADSLRLFIDTVRILTDDDVVKLNALSDAASRLTKFKGIETPQVDEDVSKNIDRAGVSARNAMSFISGFDNALKKLAGGSAKAAGIAIKAVFYPLTTAASKFKNAAVKAGQFLSSIKRIAMYRAIRSAIKAITEGFEEGRKNLYYYSQAVGTDFAPSMDKAATAALYLKNSIGAATAPLTNYLVPMIDKAVDHVVDLINVFNELTATLTGAQTWTKALKYPTQWQDALDDTTKSAKKLKSTMLGFDELNIIEPISPAAKSAKFDMDDYAKMFTEMTTSQTWKNNLPEVVLPIKLAWDAQGDKTIQTIKNTWKEILGLLGAVGESFRTVWTNGTGQKTLELLLEITQNIVGTFGALAKNIKEAWKEGDKGTRIIQSVWNVANNLLTVFRDIWGSIREWAADLNWNPLLESFDGLFKAVDKLTNPDGGAMQLLKGLFNKVLLPLGKWTIESALPIAVDTLASAVNFLDTALEKIEPIAKKFWDGFLQPIADWSGSAIIDDMKSMKTMLDELSETMNGDFSIKDILSKFSPDSENGADNFASLMTLWNPLMFNPFTKKMAKSASSAMAESEGSMQAGVQGTSFFKNFKSDFLDGIDQIKDGWEKMTTKINDSIEKMRVKMSLWENSVNSALQIVKTKVTKLKDDLVTAWETLGTWIYDWTEGIKTTYRVAFDIIGDKVAEFRDKFTKRFEEIKSGVATSVEGVKKHVTDFFTDFSIMQSAAKFRDDILDFFDGIWGKDDNTGIRKIFNNIKNTATNAFGEIEKAITKVFDNISGVIKNPLNNALKSMEDFANSAIDAIAFVLDSLKSLTGPAAEAFQKVTGISLDLNWNLGHISLTPLANGGMVESGQLFLAREAGPELVGQYGVNSAVMNNQQIVKAVSDGVYRAVTQAMAQSGNRETVVQSHIYLDRKELTAQVQQQEQSNGASIFGDVIYT